jgi:hypothetical protein
MIHGAILRAKLNGEETTKTNFQQTAIENCVPSMKMAI